MRVVVVVVFIRAIVHQTNVYHPRYIYSFI